MTVTLNALAVGIVGVFLYYRPAAKATKVSDLPLPGKYPGHVKDLMNWSHQWFEDPKFFLKVF